MKNIIVLAFIACLGWYGYGKYEQRKKEMEYAAAISEAAETKEIAWSTLTRPANETRFSCDGRTYCSQMTSCAEATYFLKNCPGTKMDGNNDGIPCEKQWCP